MLRALKKEHETIQTFKMIFDISDFWCLVGESNISFLKKEWNILDDSSPKTTQATYCKLVRAISIVLRSRRLRITRHFTLLRSRLAHTTRPKHTFFPSYSTETCIRPYRRYLSSSKFMYSIRSAYYIKNLVLHTLTKSCRMCSLLHALKWPFDIYKV